MPSDNMWYSYVLSISQQCQNGETETNSEYYFAWHSYMPISMWFYTVITKDRSLPVPA